MLDHLMAWLTRWDDLHALEALDDRMLGDMGLERANLRRRVLGQNEDATIMRSAPGRCATLARHRP